jgi:hypothetical protein
MSQQQQQKNYLFVSNHCQHSKRLLMQLQKSPLVNAFQIVNIDDPRIQLPQFVQCVPTLYIPSKRHVLTDSDLFQWFQNEFQKELTNETINAGKINIADITGDASILPFQISEMGNGLSGAAYSFLEDDKNDLMNQNYSFLQDRDINKMPDFTRHDAPSTLGGGGGGNKGAGMQQRKTGGSTDQAYDMMMKARSADMQQRAPPQTPNFSSPY